MAAATEFYGEFSNRRKELEENIDGIENNDDKLACLEEISELSELCKSRLHFLPQYDQKVYSEQLQKLADKVEAKTVKSKPKFSFKKRPAKSSSQKDETSSTGTTLNRDDETTPTQTSTPMFIDMRDSYCTSAHDTPANLHISNLQHCLVKLTDVTFSTAQIDDLKNCVILINNVEGPIHITNAQDCYFAVACHQLRIHKSNKVTMAVSCRSKRPIMEASTDMKFSTFPDQLNIQNVELFEWDTVDDFDWLKSTPSENWSRIDANFPSGLDTITGITGTLTASQEAILD